MKKKQSQLIDYMKGFSIISIVLYHLISNYSDAPLIVKTASKFGGAGVYIFLICSGFGLYYSSIFNKLTWISFIKKRLNKVYFPYIFIVFISSIFPFMYIGTNKIQALLSHIFLYKMFIEKYEASFGIQFWFISTIIQFYLVFNLLCFIKNRLDNKKFLIFSILISLLWATFISSFHLAQYRIWSSFFLQYIWCFSLGMIMSDLYYQGQTIPNKMNRLLFLIPSFIILFSIYSGMSLIGGPLKLFNDFFSMGAFGLLILITYKIDLIKETITSIARFSYELFLIHILIFSVTFNLLKQIIPNYLVCIIAFILCIILSNLYHLAINRTYRILQKTKE